MNHSTTVNLTRREFVATSGTVAGAVMMPVSLLAAPIAQKSVSAPYAFAGRSALGCEYHTVKGVMRPKAWHLACGGKLELESAPDGGIEIHLTDPFGANERFAGRDLQFGLPQDAIRHRFGDEVLSQIIQEVDRLLVYVQGVNDATTS